MNKEEVLKLAKLARIEIGGDEAETLSHEFDAILKYIDEIKSAKVLPLAPESQGETLKNVMREDVNPHESELHTEALLAEVPSREENFVKVKKIL